MTLSDDKVAAFEAQQRQKKIEKLCDERMVEYDRYYQTVLLTLGFKKYLEAHARDCRFVSAEPCFTNVDGAEIRPDMVLQHNGKQGILCEIKTSLPLKDEHLLGTLKQLERYSKEVIGWETIDRKVDHQDVMLFCHAFDYDRVLEKMNQWIADGALKVSEISLCEWVMAQNPKTRKEELLIRLRDGRTSCDELNMLLKKNINVDVQQLVVEYEECKFTRKEPPIEYTMNQLWLHVFSEISKNSADFEVSTEKLLEIVYEYYITWSNVKGEYSQVREKWIKKALQGFCEIGLAEEVPDKPSIYKILMSKKIEKDFQEYITEKLCEKSIDSKIAQKPVLEINKDVTPSLSDFI
jgi:hypothetical protein